VSEPVLSVRNLEVAFPTRRRTLTAVDRVSFDIAPGEVLGVVGESGAGKSLTGAAIIGLLEPPGRIGAGQILLEGERIDNLPAEAMRRIRGRKIGAIFQDPLTSLNPLYSVGRQLVETMQTHLDINAAQAKRRAIDLLQSTGIQAAAQRIEHYPHQFSGGMRQRVLIAMAIAGRPKVLLADEPTTALDVTIQDQILKLLLGLQQEFGMSLVFVTHDLAVVAQTCQSLAVMYAGEVIETGSVHDVFHEPRHPYTLGLLRSVPDFDVVRDSLESIPGAPPDLVSPPPGCRFAPRCAFAQDDCLTGDKPLYAIGGGRQTACIHPEDAARAVLAQPVIADG
jgi:peptide/nickel transport system ATP-binding protein